MADDALLLSEDAARRIAAATRAVEQGGERGHRRGFTPNTAIHGLARTTQAGSGANYIPGKIVVTNDNIIYTDFGDCYVTDLNDNWLDVRRYFVRFIGVHSDGKPVVSVDYCCGEDAAGDSDPIEIKCYACRNPPPCLAVLVNDGFGWQGTVYIPLSSASGRDCFYFGTAITPNATLELRLGIREFRSPGFPPAEPGSYSTISGQSHQSFILGGFSAYHDVCSVWDGSTSQYWPLGFAESQGGTNIPQIINAQGVTDPALCAGGAAGGAGGIGGGAGGGTSFDACVQACNDAYGAGTSGADSCIAGCAAFFFGPGGVGLRSAGCSSGDCGCETCVGSAPSSAFSELRFWSLVDHVNTLATATVEPLYENYADGAGNVGSGEDTLYSDTIDANTLSADGDTAEINVTFKVAAGRQGRPRVRFDGDIVYDFGTNYPLSADVVDTYKSVRIFVTRSSATTARVTSTGANEEAKVYDLTGLNFGAAIEVLATGEATLNNDITAVHSLTVKIPSSTTLTDAGVTTVQVLSYGPSHVLAIPHSAGAFDGTGSSELCTGSGSGALDVDVFAIPNVTVGDGQVVRVFKEVDGVKVLVKEKIIEPRTSNASSDKWREPIYITTVRLSGTTDKIFVSKEKNEAMIARGEKKNYFTYP